MLIFKEEKEVTSVVLEHVRTTDDCLKQARKTLEAYMAGDFGIACESERKVNSLESDADTLKRKIRTLLFSGAFLPHIRADIYHVVASLDSVAGKGEAVCRFLVNQNPSIPEEFEADFIEIFTLCVTCFHELRSSLKHFLKPKGKFDQLLDHINRVGELETEVDEKEEELTRRIFNSSIELAEKQHLARLLTLIGDIADKAESASDELEYAAMKAVV